MYIIDRSLVGGILLLFFLSTNASPPAAITTSAPSIEQLSPNFTDTTTVAPSPLPTATLSPTSMPSTTVPNIVNDRANNNTVNDSAAPTSTPTTTVPPTSMPSTTMPSTPIPSTTATLMPSTTLPTSMPSMMPTSMPSMTVSPTSTLMPPTSLPSTTMPSTTAPQTSTPPTTVLPTSTPTSTVPSTSAPTTTVPPTIASSEAPVLLPSREPTAPPTLGPAVEVSTTPAPTNASSQSFQDGDWDVYGHEDNEEMLDSSAPGWSWTAKVATTAALLTCIVLAVVWARRRKRYSGRHRLYDDELELGDLQSLEDDYNEHMRGSSHLFHDSEALRLLRSVLRDMNIPEYGMEKYEQMFRNNGINDVEQLQVLDDDDWRRLNMPLVIQGKIRQRLEG